MKENVVSYYVCPTVEIIEVKSEGLLCSSRDEQIEAMKTNNGSWGGHTTATIEL